jgi:hypothetical protein
MKQGTEYGITDFGKALESKCQPISCQMINDDCMYIEYRYGVWRLEDNIPKEVIEASNDFNYLVKKYNVKRLISVGLWCIEKPLTYKDICDMMSLESE